MGVRANLLTPHYHPSRSAQRQTIRTGTGEFTRDFSLTVWTQEVAKFQTQNVFEFIIHYLYCHLSYPFGVSQNFMLLRFKFKSEVLATLQVNLTTHFKSLVILWVLFLGTKNCSLWEEYGESNFKIMYFSRRKRTKITYFEYSQENFTSVCIGSNVSKARLWTYTKPAPTRYYM